MTDLRTRLERGAVALAVIDLRRQETQDPTVGAATERFIVERELKELEEAMAAASQESAAPAAPRRRRRVLLSVAGRWFRK